MQDIRNQKKITLIYNEKSQQERAHAAVGLLLHEKYADTVENLNP